MGSELIDVVVVDHGKCIVHVGFGTLNIHCLYSLVFRESSLMFTHTSRKGNLPSCSGSVVNLMLESRLFRWVVNSSTW